MKSLSVVCYFKLERELNWGFGILSGSWLWGGMGWQLPPLATRCHPFATPEDFLAIFYCCFIIVAAKESSPKILVEINLGLCNIQESSIFSCIH